MKHRFKGMIFILSAVPFRSAWKYGDRSWRYCFLDAGHQLGALEAAGAACDREFTILSEFDGECLDRLMGFSMQEFSIAVMLSGEATQRGCNPMKKPLMQVAPTDYFESDAELFNAFHTTGVKEVVLTNNGYEKVDGLEAVILTRRSARGFDATALEQEDLEQFLHMASRTPEPLVCHTLVLRGEPLPIGLYEGGRLVRQGDYSREITALAVGQSFVSASSLVLILSASAFGAEALMGAAAFAHTLQLHSCARRLGFSGIGAFYDRKLQHFLNTDNSILYMMVIGNERDSK
jgi:hypothetical protein